MQETDFKSEWMALELAHSLSFEMGSPWRPTKPLTRRPVLPRRDELAVRFNPFVEVCIGDVDSLYMQRTGVSSPVAHKALVTMAST